MVSSEWQNSLRSCSWACAPVVHRGQTPEALLPCGIPDFKLDDILLCTVGPSVSPVFQGSPNAETHPVGTSGSRKRRLRFATVLRSASPRHTLKSRAPAHQWSAPCWPGSRSGRSGGRRKTCQLRIRLSSPMEMSAQCPRPARSRFAKSLQRGGQISSSGCTAAGVSCEAAERRVEARRGGLTEEDEFDLHGARGGCLGF